MDKVKVNNQVVKMRKHVKRAKLFAINKFTKQLKQLQTKKIKNGNDSLAEKNQRKVERLLEKVLILKKMMPDIVSKKALSKAQEWNAVLAQKNVPLEDQCLALLANDKEVQKEVEKFHTEESQLAEKIPSLLLEWEMKSKLPKTPDKNKKASDIKKLKKEKIAKRKISNFKGATFPNNVAVEKKSKSLDKKKQKQHSDTEISNLEGEKNENENSMEVDLDESDQLSDGLENGESKEFSKNSYKNEIEKPKTNETDTNESDQLESELSDDDESGEFFIKDTDNYEKLDEESDPMEDNLNEKPMLDDKSLDDSSHEKSGESFTTTSIRKLPAKQVKNNKKVFQRSIKSVSNVDSSLDGNKDSDSIKNSSSIFERLSALANPDTRKQKAKNIKPNPASQRTKAIKVLDLNELQDTDLIPIESMSPDSQEPDTPLIVKPKKDSFFLNGDDEVESSDDELNSNGFRDFKPKGKFSKFDHRGERGSKFQKNGFGDRPPKSFNSFKDDNRSENKFQNRNGKGLNRREKRFQSRKAMDFSQNEGRFQKNLKGNSKFNDKKKFDFKSKGSQFDHSNPTKKNDSPHFRRENKKNAAYDNSKKQSNEKDVKNEALHPSWQAKNKLKEAAKSGFQGKRMVFD